MGHRYLAEEWVEGIHEMGTGPTFCLYGSLNNPNPRIRVQCGALAVEILLRICGLLQGGRA